MAHQTLVRNDTGPNQVHICLDQSGVVVDVTGATVRFHMHDSGGATKVDAAGAVVSGPAGSVRYVWTASDTDTSGLFTAEFELTGSGAGGLASGEIQTFPKNHKLQIRIVGDLE